MVDFIDLWRAFLLAATPILFGVIVIWAAVARAPLFWRCAAVLAACGLMVPTVAHQLAVFGLIASASVLLPAMLIQALLAWRRGTASLWRFSLVQLLQWTLLACAAAGIVSYSVNHSAPTNWRLLIAAALLYGLSLIAVLPALRLATNRWWHNALLVPALLALTIAYAAASHRLRWLDIDDYLSPPSASWPRSTTELAALLQMSLLSVWLADWSFCHIVRPLALRQSNDETPPRTWKVASAWMAVLAVTSAPVMVTAGYMYVVMAKPALPLPAQPTGENHYPELAALALPLRSVNFDECDNVPLDELNAFHESHGPTLQKIRQVMQRPCYLPLAKSKQAWLDDIDSINLPRTFANTQEAVGELHERRGDANAAADAYLQALRFADCTTRGGLIVDALVAGAAEATTIDRLHAIRQQLTGEQCRRLARQLEQLDARREPWSTYEQRDLAWMDRVWGWDGRLYEVLEIDPIIEEEQMRQSAKRRAALMRLAAAELAILAFHAENGRWPRDLAELTPKFLAQVPQDPFAARPLCYQPQGERYLLYSVGKNGVDDGGRVVGIFPADHSDHGDIALDGFAVKSEFDW